MFVFVGAHEPVKQLCLFLVCPVPSTTGTAIFSNFGVIGVVIVAISPTFLASALGVGRLELFALGRRRGRLTIDGLHRHLVGRSIKRNVVCVMSCPRMVGGYNVGARVVTVVMRTRIEANLREVRI